MTEKIEEHCQNNNVSIVEKIMYDSVVPKAIVNKKPVVEYTDREIARQIENI
jgi:MinD superfamily P-loop ATPase